MSQHQNEGVGQTFRNGETGAMPQFAVIVPDPSNVTDGILDAKLAATGDRAAGLPLMQNAKDAWTEGDPVTGVRLEHYSTFNMIAGGVVAIGDAVVLGTAGKVLSGAPGIEQVGVAMSAAGADGDYITVMPVTHAGT